MVKDLGLQVATKASLDKTAADELRRAILTGRAAPGARLTEQQLADEMSVSRGTIRAALQRLASEGLVAQKPYSGWAVISLTAEDAWELATLRGALEGLGARISAETMTPEKRAAIEAAFERLCAALAKKDPRRVNVADMMFHQTVVDLAGHHRLSEHYHRVGQQVQMCIVSSTALQPDYGVLADRHAKLVKAVVEDGPEAAETAFRAHSLDSGAEIAARFREDAEG